METYADQHGARVRFDWGVAGAAALAPSVRACAVVDVLSFTTAVSVAADAGATVFPYRWGDSGAAEYAAQHGAVLAVHRWLALADPGAVSLSPGSLRAAASWLTRVVLPSPNGSTISAVIAEMGTEVVAASLRNRIAVARHLAAHLDTDRAVSVAVIAAGEQWPDGSLRPALEDLLGAGGVLAALEDLGQTGLSAEARAAAASYRALVGDLDASLRSCASGRELTDRGFPHDVDVAAELDVTSVVPVLGGPCFHPFRAGVVIRPADVDDAGPVADVHLIAFREALPSVRRPHDDDHARAWVRDTLIPAGHTWVAEHRGRVVGMLTVADGWVDQLYVDPAHQGRGIGTALLDVAKARSTAGLELWTFQVNSQAQGFYAQQGFHAEEHTDGSANMEREPDVRLVWLP
jgi:2-phosphosulfolactate phosphatase